MKCNLSASKIVTFGNRQKVLLALVERFISQSAGDRVNVGSIYGTSVPFSLLTSWSAQQLNWTLIKVPSQQLSASEMEFCRQKLSYYHSPPDSLDSNTWIFRPSKHKASCFSHTGKTYTQGKLSFYFNSAILLPCSLLFSPAKLDAAHITGGVWVTSSNMKVSKLYPYYMQLIPERLASQLTKMCSNKTLLIYPLRYENVISDCCLSGYLKCQFFKSVMLMSSEH